MCAIALFAARGQFVSFADVASERIPPLNGPLNLAPHLPPVISLFPQMTCGLTDYIAYYGEAEWGGLPVGLYRLAVTDGHNRVNAMVIPTRWHRFVRVRVRVAPTQP